MKAVPGTLQDGGAPFLTTHWSVVAACSDLTTGAAHAALTQLCRDYWPPLYSFVRRRGYSRADAQDLVQGFFAYLLQSKAYAQTDRNKGKFRSFLLASLKHYLSDVWDRERALKRGGDQKFVLLDEMNAAETFMRANPSPRHWTRNNSTKAWAATLVHVRWSVSEEFENGRRRTLPRIAAISERWRRPAQSGGDCGAARDAG